MSDIQILSSSQKGFDVVLSFDGWQIGMIRYSDVLKKATKERLEKHELTDEAFVLLKGKASIYVGIELEKTEMKTGFVYNIPQNVWHTITLSEDACVIVMENIKTEIHDKILLTQHKKEKS